MRSPEKLEVLLREILSKAGIMVAGLKVAEDPNPAIFFELYYQPGGFFTTGKIKRDLEDKSLNAFLDYDQKNPGNEWSLWPEDTEYHYKFIPNS